MPLGSRRERPGTGPEPLVLTNDQKRALRAAQLELLAEFDRVCKARGVEYFAMYGTALGAVRHSGFIPWDDDLDIGMLRSDFDRLRRFDEGDWGERFFFQTVHTDPHFGCMFGKLRMVGTRCVDRVSFGSAQQSGVSIDVFPLDAVSPRALSRFVQQVARFVGFRLLYVKAGYLVGAGTSLPAKVVQALARAVARIVPRRIMIATIERLTTLGRAEGPDRHVSLFGGYPYSREMVDAAWIHPLVDVPFEGGTIPTFADVDAYLTHLYGDYLQLPPVDQQVGPHDLVELDLTGTGP